MEDLLPDTPSVEKSRMPGKTTGPLLLFFVMGGACFFPCICRSFHLEGTVYLFFLNALQTAPGDLVVIPGG